MSELHGNVKMLTEIVFDLDTDVREWDLPEDLDTDLIALQMIKDARSNLAVLERDLENALAKAMPEKVMVVEGAGTFERSKKKSRTQWDRDALLPTVLDSRMFDPNTGELVEETPLDRVLAVWNLGAPRITVLRERGIDADQFCSTEDAGWSIRFQS